MVKKILSIDGGALAGVIPLAVCIAIEKETGKQLKDIFDLFIGTSTGSLITSAALRGIIKDRTNPEDTTRDRSPQGFGMKASDILQVYYDQADFIFGDGAINPGSTTIPILNVTKYPKYNPARLITVVRDVFGGGNLTALKRSPENLSITAYDLTERKPCFFRSWTGDYQDMSIVDAVMASSTVPNTHPVHPYNGSFFVDGGVFASNPAMYAFMEARSLYGDDEEIILVSLGTGTDSKSRVQTERPKDDVIWWLENIFSIFLDGQSESTDTSLISLEKSDAKLKYFRFNVDLEKKDSQNPGKELLEDLHSQMNKRLENSDVKFMFNKMIDLL